MRFRTEFIMIKIVSNSILNSESGHWQFDFDIDSVSDNMRKILLSWKRPLNQYQKCLRIEFIIRQCF